MKRLIVHIWFVALPITAFSAFEDAIKKYDERKFHEALLEFEAIYKEDSTDIAVLYNLGLCYHATKQHAKARWAFERGLRLSPGDSDMEVQLEATIVDLGFKESYTPYHKGLNKTIAAVGSTNWAIISLVAALMLSILIVLFARKKEQRFFFGFLVIFATGIIVTSVIAGFKCQTLKNAIEYVVVIESVDSEKNIQPGQRLKLVKRSPTIVTVKDQKNQSVSLPLSSVAFI